MQNEEAFEAEARDEALSGSDPAALVIEDLIAQTPDPSDRQYFENQPSSEESPLLPGKSATAHETAVTDSASDDGGRAIHQPWLGAQGSEGFPWHKKPSILWLLPAFLPFCLAFGGIIVPKTYLVLDLICRDYLMDKENQDPTFKFLPVIFGEENPQCRDPNVQALVARFQLYASLLSGIFSAIVSPHLGALSDRVGRKKIIAFATMGTFLGEIITVIVGTHPGLISVYWLLAGSLLDGLCGSFPTAMALSFAYASDCTPPERRNVAFGFFHGTLFTGVAFGPILAGYLIKLTGDLMVVFYVAIGCHLFFILFLLLVVPESVSKERQLHAKEKHRLKKAGSRNKSWFTVLRTYNLFEPLSILWPKGPGSSPTLRKNLVLLAAIDTLMFGVAMGTIQILIIYAEFMFGWTAFDSSIFMSAVNICRVTTLVIFVPLITRVVRGPMKNEGSGSQGADKLDIGLIRCAIIFDLLGYIGYACSRTGAMMLLSGIVASFGGMGPPTLQSALTKHIPSDRTGQILGASGLLHALSRIVGPTIFNLIYSQTVGTFPQTVFVCLASVFVVISLLTWFLKSNVYLKQ